MPQVSSSLRVVYSIHPDLTKWENQPDLLGVHPAAELEPPMTTEEFAALKEDIRKHGLREPVDVDASGQIIDGRHRVAACIEVGAPLRLKLYEGDDAEGYVLSKHCRRDLTKGQKAVIAHRLTKGKKLQKKLSGKSGSGSKKHQKKLFTQLEAATRLGISRAHVQRAARVEEELGSDTLDQVWSGEVSLTEANRKATQRTEKADLNTHGLRAQEPPEAPTAARVAAPTGLSIPSPNEPDFQIKARNALAELTANMGEFVGKGGSFGNDMEIFDCAVKIQKIVPHDPGFK